MVCQIISPAHTQRLDGDVSMKLYQETRIQAIMLVSTAIGLVAILGLLLAGLILSHMPYLIGAGILLVIVFVVISIGEHWTQKTMARIQRIKEGGGDEADLEWVTRKGSGFTKVEKK